MMKRNEGTARRRLWTFEPGGRGLSMAAMLLASLFMMAGCHLFGEKKSKIFVPQLDTAQEQWEFAQRVYEARVFKPKDNPALIRARMNEIIAALDMVVQRFPDDRQFTPLALSQEAKAFNDYEEYDKALAVSEKCLVEYNDIPYVDARAHFEKGKALGSLNRVEEAQATFKECIDLYENSDDFRVKYIVSWCRSRYKRLIPLED